MTATKPRLVLLTRVAFTTGGWGTGQGVLSVRKGDRGSSPAGTRWDRQEPTAFVKVCATERDRAARRQGRPHPFASEADPRSWDALSLPGECHRQVPGVTSYRACASRP